LASTRLGLSADEAERFEETMQAIYANAYGESFEEIGAALVTVEQQFKRIGVALPDEQLQDVTEKAFALKDAFGVEMTESLGAVTTLVEKFGITTDQAFGFITSGFQRGLNSSDDFLESVSEYGVQFSNMGASAEEFFSILETGAQAGVLGTDKIADAYKEFNIRIVDNSKLTRESLALIGIDYDELTKQFEEGSITQADAAQMVIDKLGEIEDPIQRNIVGVGLFGTQWEDVTEDVILNIDAQKTGLGELEQSTADLSTQYDTTKAKWQEASREMQVALLPIGEALMDMGARIMPHVVDYLNNVATPAVTRWANALANAVERFNEGMKAFEGAPSAEEMFFGGAIPPSLQSNPSLQTNPNLGIVNPLNQLPSTPPPGWVGAWNPGMGNTGNVTVNQNFYGGANADAVRDATQQGVLDAQRSVGN
jgi:phage-related minor tail protein